MRLDQLTFTRFVAAVAIVIFHFGKGTPPFNTGPLFALMNNANVAVSYFFCLSGFVMIIAYEKGKHRINIKQYYINRIAKIYPVYVLALILMLVTVTDINWLQLITEALLIHSAIPPFSLAYNLPDWSLSVEVFFYLIFPLLYNKFYLKTGIIKITGMLMAFWAVSQIIFYFLSLHLNEASIPAMNAIYYSPLSHINEFLIGNLTGLTYLQLQNKPALKKDYVFIAFLAALIIIGLFILTTNTQGNKLPVNIHNGLLLIVFAPFILLLALNNGYISRLFSNRLFIYMGEISYCIYILQFPVFMGWRYVFNLESPLFNVYVPLTILIAFSAFIYVMVELPGKIYLKEKLKGL